MTIGLLDLQGDVREHAAAFSALGESTRRVRRPSDVDGLDGLVIPGGESTTLSMLLESSGLFDPLREQLDAGLPAFGTCAGMILLARSVLDGRPDQRQFGTVDMTVRRNGYGPQAASFECDVDAPVLGGDVLHSVFIRAPVVESVGAGVEVLASLPPSGDGARPRPVLCRSGPVLVAAFHPELTGDIRVHRLFVEMTKEERR